MMAIITLLTDFGTKDGFVGTMKGVIWKIDPTIQIADISHEIAPQNIMEGAIALWRAVPFFPEGTVHIAVVDPGVGTSRRPMAAHIGSQLFVGPDNGLFTPIIEDAKKFGQPMRFVHLDNPAYWLPNVSHTFHGRDIFAPVGAHLASGFSIDKVGSVFTDPRLIPLMKPEKTSTGFNAHITVIDIFGNLTTDLSATEFAGKGIEVTIKGRVIDGLSTSYGHRDPGQLVTLVDSENFLEVAVVNGNAAKQLDAKVGDLVKVDFKN
jgi:S-adenosyl-L-methionine hydrolase (adenosine-forming)